MKSEEIVEGFNEIAQAAYQILSDLAPFIIGGFVAICVTYVVMMGLMAVGGKALAKWWLK